MKFQFKLTGKEYDAISNILDLYWAEVDSGEWQAGLLDINDGVLEINGVDGAVMFLENSIGEIDLCREAMHGIYREPSEYGEAYRIHRRIKKINLAVLTAFPEAREHFGYLGDYLPKKQGA